MELHTSPEEYASALGIDVSVASFNLQYLLEAGLVEGQAIGSLGTTRKFVSVSGLTASGIDAVEGRYGRELAINYSIINVSAPVTGSQLAVGHQINQSQSVSINDFNELYNYVNTKLDKSQREALRPILEELEAEVRNDSVKPSTLKKVRETIKTWEPIAIPIIEALAKLIGLKS